MNNHNLLIPGKMLEKLQGSDGWWFGPNDTWTSTTLLLACLPPPATRSHLLTSSLFQQGKTQPRKGKQELLTLWIEIGRIHGCAPIFLLHSSLGGEICAFEEKVADLGSIGFPRRVCVPDYCLGGPGLCQRRHSGKVICHWVTCHFSNLGPGTSKIYQTVCPLLLGNSIFQMTCISSDAPRGWLINRIWFGWISILRKPFFWIKSSTRKIELQNELLLWYSFQISGAGFSWFSKVWILEAGRWWRGHQGWSSRCRWEVSLKQQHNLWAGQVN